MQKKKKVHHHIDMLFVWKKNKKSHLRDDKSEHIKKVTQKFNTLTEGKSILVLKMQVTIQHFAKPWQQPSSQGESPTNKTC